MEKSKLDTLASVPNIALFYGFIVLFCVITLVIVRAADPFNFRAPTDQMLIMAFKQHSALFEDLRQKKASHEKVEQAKLTALPGILGIGAGWNGVIRFVYAEGGLLAVGSGWAKGIEYIPGDYQKEGDIRPELDDARKLPEGVYLREIEPHWFIFYQRDN